MDVLTAVDLDIDANATRISARGIHAQCGEPRAILLRRAFEWRW